MRSLIRNGAAIAVVLAGVGLSSEGWAQYVEPEEEEPSGARYLSLGMLWWDFAPTSSNPSTGDGPYGHSSLLPVAGFHQGPVDLIIGYGSHPTPQGSRSTVVFSTTLSMEIQLTRSRPAALVLPLLLAADYTKVQSAEAGTGDFNIGSLGAGLGLRYRVASGSMEWVLSATGTAQYSFEGFRPVYGFSAVALGEMSVLWKKIGIGDGLVVGYRFRYQKWSMQEDILDYRVLAHGPYVGVLL
jgi:hypothetical protein